MSLTTRPEDDAESSPLALVNFIQQSPPHAGFSWVGAGNHPVDAFGTDGRCSKLNILGLFREISYFLYTWYSEPVGQTLLYPDEISNVRFHPLFQPVKIFSNLNSIAWDGVDPSELLISRHRSPQALTVPDRNGRALWPAGWCPQQLLCSDKDRTDGGRRPNQGFGI